MSTKESLSEIERKYLAGEPPYDKKTLEKKTRQYKRLLKSSKGNTSAGFHSISKSMFEIKKEAIQKLGGTCVSCGIDDIRILVINHKHNGDFNRVIMFREMKKKNPVSWKAVLEGTYKEGDVELRCYNCNILYEYETGRRKIPQ